MNAEPNDPKLTAAIGIGLGIGLLALGGPLGLRPLGGPAMDALWPVAAIGCLVYGVAVLTHGVESRGQREENVSAPRAPLKKDPPPFEDLEAKLRELLRLKEEKLITDEEYTRKRTDLLAKW